MAWITNYVNKHPGEVTIIHHNRILAKAPAMGHNTPQHSRPGWRFHPPTGNRRTRDQGRNTQGGIHNQMPAHVPAMVTASLPMPPAAVLPDAEAEEQTPVSSDNESVDEPETLTTESEDNEGDSDPTLLDKECTNETEAPTSESEAVEEDSIPSKEIERSEGIEPNEPVPEVQDQTTTETQRRYPTRVRSRRDLTDFIRWEDIPNTTLNCVNTCYISSV